VTQHTTAYSSMQVVDITLAEHCSTSRAKYKHSLFITNQSHADKEMLLYENITVLSVITTK
jgi:hypothetical protein